VLSAELDGVAYAEKMDIFVRARAHPLLPRSSPIVACTAAAAGGRDQDRRCPTARPPDQTLFLERPPSNSYSRRRMWLKRLVGRAPFRLHAFILLLSGLSSLRAFVRSLSLPLPTPKLLFLRGHRHERTRFAVKRKQKQGRKARTLWNNLAREN
jgi:hypothetical protein